MGLNALPAVIGHTSWLIVGPEGKTEKSERGIHHR